MIKKAFFVFALICIFSAKLFCQSRKFFTTTQVLKDSIEIKYITNGADKYQFFASERQACLDSAIAIAPDDDVLWHEKAMPYFKCRKYEVGLRYIDTAVILNADRNLDYRAFIKCIFCKTYKAAIVDFINAKKLKGNFTMMEHPYSFYIGLSYLQLNKFDSAEAFFNETINTKKADGGEATIHFMDWFYLGIVNYEKKNYQQAINFFNKTLSRYSNFSEAEYYKAYCMIYLNSNHDDVNKLFNDAFQNFKKGYSFTEDNCVYEKYPYQLSAYMVR